MFYDKHLGRTTCRSSRSGKPCGLHKENGPHRRHNPTSGRDQVQPIRRLLRSRQIPNIRTSPSDTKDGVLIGAEKRLASDCVGCQSDRPAVVDMEEDQLVATETGLAEQWGHAL